MPSRTYREPRRYASARARDAHRDAIFEILFAFGIDIDIIPCTSDLCWGGRRCPEAEAAAIERFAELWEIDEC